MEAFKEYVKNIEIPNSLLKVHLILICDSLLCLQNENNIKKAQDILEPVWKYYEIRNKWYVNDIKIISLILFIFPIDTAEHMTRRALKFIEEYPSPNNYIKLKLNLLINVSLLFIKSNSAEKSLNYLEKALEISKDNGLYLHYGAAVIRKGIAMKMLNQNNTEDFISRGIQILNLSENYEALDSLLDEAKLYAGYAR
ncbi:hypothetical protein ACQKND_13515 [Viridibacillus arvi]|uniref:hypothetical protein n=1 Tax=Viridibacillus arvi TaxID=263475 RepID=UPI003D0078DA